jgi:hypothetical protein
MLECLGMYWWFVKDLSPNCCELWQWVMCGNLCFIISKCCDWVLYLGNQMGKLGTKGFEHHITWVLKRKDIHVCCTMWLNLWGGCLVQLGKKDIICLSQIPNDPWCSNRKFYERSHPPPPKLSIYLGLQFRECLELGIWLYFDVFMYIILFMFSLCSSENTLFFGFYTTFSFSYNAIWRFGGCFFWIPHILQNLCVWKRFNSLDPCNVWGSLAIQHVLSLPFMDCEWKVRIATLKYNLFKLSDL